MLDGKFHRGSHKMSHKIILRNELNFKKKIGKGKGSKTKAKTE